MRTQHRLAILMMTLAAAGLWPLLRDPIVLAQPIRCERGIMVGGGLRCPVASLRVGDWCRAMGLWPPTIDRPLHPGDALDPIPVCMLGRQTTRMPPARLAGLGLPVNVNEADAAELASLPGIGPTLARRIALGRPFASVEALLGVRGIGPARLAALRERAVTGWD